MSLLSSLLVRDRVVPVRKVEEAIQRQVIAGGTLDTALLEMDAVPENVLASYCASLHDHPPLSRQQINAVSAEISGLVAKDVAERYRVLPVAVSETVTLAASQPLGAEQRQQLGSLVGKPVEVAIVTDARLAAALAHHYGIALLPRMRRLVRKLDQRDPGELPGHTAPPSDLPQEAQEASQALRQEQPQEKRRGTDLFVRVPAADERPPPSQPPLSPSDTPSPGTRTTRTTRTTDVGLGRVVSVGSSGNANEAPAASQARPAEPTKTLRRPKSEPAPRKPLRLHGPLLPKKAAELLTEVEDRDAILEVFFAFARQFFDYSALFVVHEDIAEGRDAFGSGATGEEVRQFAVPLDVPGAFGRAHQTGQAEVVDLRKGELDRVVSADLGRGKAQPCLVLPVAIRGRVVLLVYGDRDGQPFALADVPELIGFTPRISDAFERLILKRKGGSVPKASLSVGEGSPAAAAPPSVPPQPAPAGKAKSGAQVLLGALTRKPSTGPKAGSPPEPKPPAASPEPPSAGSYQMVGAQTEVVPGNSSPPHPSTASEQPPKREPKPTVRELPAARRAASAGGANASLPRIARRSEPTVIVDMGQSVQEKVDELLLRGPDDEGDTVAALLDCGEAALPVLVQRFPGPLWFDRKLPHRRLPRGRDLSAVARALTAFGERAVPYLPPLLQSSNGEVRFYATLLASEFPTPDVVRPVYERVFDDDLGVRALALDVLKLFSHFEEYQQILHELRAAARFPGKEPKRQAGAVLSLGQLRDAGSVEILVGLLQDDEQLAEAAHRSLVTITRQDFGRSQRKWRSWYERNRGRHRIQWLIDSLLHPDASTRAAASDELKRVTREYFGYHPSLPKREREIAHRKYCNWWESEGHSRFAGPTE